MMSIKQISVFLENKPGTLNHMTRVLAEGGVDLRALSLAETSDYGIARIIVDDVMKATTILKDADFVASLTPVLAYEIPNEPDGLNKLLMQFTEAAINIEYMYSCIIAEKREAYMIIRVSDVQAAEAALTDRMLKALSSDKIL